MWRNLEAHLIWVQEVAGSNPIIPTIFKGSAMKVSEAIEVLRHTDEDEEVQLIFKKKKELSREEYHKIQQKKFGVVTYRMFRYKV